MTTDGCAEYRDLLVEVLYEEADAQARERWSRHAAGCEGCRSRLEELRGVRGKVSAARPAAAAPAAPPVLLLRPRIPLLYRAAVLAAAAALAAVAILGLVRQELTLVPGPGEVAGPPLTREERESIVRAAVEEIERQRANELARMVEAVRLDLDRRDDAWRQTQESILSGLVAELDVRRQQDLRFVMEQMGSLELRTGQEVARTQQIVELAMMGRDPAAFAER